MLRKDYIMRLVAQVTRAIAAIVARRQASDATEAERLIGQTCTDLLGLEFEFLDSVPIEQLKTLFTVDQELDVGKCVVAGELFAQAAALSRQRGQDARGEAYLLKSLSLFGDAYRTLPDKERRLYAQKTVDILEQLPEHNFTGPELLTFVLAYEVAGHYDRAEDLLFELAEAREPGAVELGLALYQRLQLQSDDALEQGGLPRDEVVESLQELRRLRDAGG